MTAGTLAEKIALELLARDGASAVWQLHVVAAKVYRDGGARAAGGPLDISDAGAPELGGGGAAGFLLDIADAAERNLASRVVIRQAAYLRNNQVCSVLCGPARCA